ncbi:MAG: Fis family transcriptional regulator [Sulfurovum sp.]|nr:Fis family transcriptional regulator [Sulfurovum sp.]
MKPVQFLSNSPKVKQIINGLTLTKSLFVASIVVGEPYIGKKSLVESIFPKGTFINGSDCDTLMHALQTQEEIIIYNFESILDLSRYDFANKRIIAIANNIHNSISIEEKFAFIYHMPSLQERPEDLSLLLEHFSNAISQELLITTDTAIDIKQLDLSENIKSFRASIYRQLITANIDQEALEHLIYKYLYEKIEGNNAYRDLLGLFERPLIKAGLSKYRSQLKLSSILGLNRNTLRKKINEHNIN